MSAPQSIELSNVSNVSNVSNASNLWDENDGANGGSEYISILPSESTPRSTLEPGAPGRVGVLVLDAAAQHTQQPGPLSPLGGKAGASAADAPMDAGQRGDALVPVPPSHRSSGALLLGGIFLVVGAVSIGMIFA